MIWITGDKHGDFSGLFQFNEGGNLTKEDLIIILGDAGINYYGDQRDSQIKEKLSTLACNILCIHGNHEQRASSIKTYKETSYEKSSIK